MLVAYTLARALNGQLEPTRVSKRPPTQKILAQQSGLFMIAFDLGGIKMTAPVNKRVERLATS
jgi:hypothetical protein